MYIYITKFNKYEQAQLLEMYSNAFIFDGIGCNDLKTTLC